MTGVRVNLGPLVTTFTYPQSCIYPQAFRTSQERYDFGCPSSDCLFRQQGQTCTDASNYDDTDCWPPRTFSPSATTAASDLSGWGYYSPGIHCPSGYYSACSATGTSTGGFSFQFPLLAAETAIGCCPSGYGCFAVTRDAQNGANTNPSRFPLQTCVTTVTAGPVILYTCSTGEPLPNTIITLPSYPMTLGLPVTSTATSTVTGLTTSTAHINSVEYFAPMFQLLRQESDLSSYPLSTATVSTPTASSSNNITQTGEDGQRLSPGAIAGISVGALFGFCAIAGAAVYIFGIKRRRRRPKGAELEATNSRSGREKAHEAPATEILEAPNEQRHELDASEREPQELP